MGSFAFFVAEKTKAPAGLRWGFCRIKSRRRPTLPRRCQRSTIGAGGLNFRVRDGNGCNPSAKATGNSENLWLRSSSRISRGVNFMVKPHDRLVLVSFMRCRTSTPSLLPGSLPGVFSPPPRRGRRDILSRGGFHAYMLSAFIPSELSYPAMPLARQLVH